MRAGKILSYVNEAIAAMASRAIRLPSTRSIACYRALKEAISYRTVRAPRDITSEASVHTHRTEEVLLARD